MLTKTQIQIQKEHVYFVKGMHCASCAGLIEKSLKKTPGVASALLSGLGFIKECGAVCG